MAAGNTLHSINEIVIPAHVDRRLVVDFDYLNPTGVEEHGDVYRAWRTLHDGPDIVWTPHYGGHWILTRGDDIKWAQQAHEIFSHEEIIVPRGMGLVMPPVTVDPPRLSRYRAVLNPRFTKAKVREIYEPHARALAVKLIEQLKPRGSCDFVRDFARIMPVEMFLSIVDLPAERREEFMAWSAGMLEPSTRAENEQKIVAFLAEILDQRAAEPGDDLFSDIAAWRKNPRFETEEEVMGMAVVMFSGGLDTVAAELSFAMQELARRPELQARLREDPAVIPAAAEEFLRRHALANTARVIRQPCEHKGVQFLPGDMVVVPVALSGMDERLYDRPLEVDFDRCPVAHNTFGNGPHRCVGEHLARMELRVFLEEWFSRMPDVRLDPACQPWSIGGSVETMSRLKLIWDA